MEIALIEPYFGGSHAQWAEQLKRHSVHSISIFSRSARHWKWRMESAGMDLAEEVNQAKTAFDLFIVSDFLNLSQFKAFLKYDAPCLLYFHENQLTYPWSEKDRDKQRGWDRHYAFINLSSALLADRVVFNSQYHFDSFFRALPPFIKAFPDRSLLKKVKSIQEKAEVIPPGLQLPTEISGKPASKVKTLLWNHRWEYDKNPDAFFEALKIVKEEGHAFKLIVCGEDAESPSPIFSNAKRYFKDEILHWGYVVSKSAYWDLLFQANILPVFSHHDFFGISVLEAIWAEVVPILPNRLAYPEHIPFELHENYLFETFEDQLKALRRALVETTASQSKALREQVEKYKWDTLIPKYDSVFEKTRNSVYVAS